MIRKRVDRNVVQGRKRLPDQSVREDDTPRHDQDYDVGFGKPPRHSRFKPGTSGNPKGRPKRKPAALGDITKNVLNTSVDYREGDRRKKATRHELMLKGLVKRALGGSVAAADKLLKLRAHSQKRDVGVQRIE